MIGTIILVYAILGILVTFITVAITLVIRPAFWSEALDEIRMEMASRELEDKYWDLTLVITTVLTFLLTTIIWPYVLYLIIKNIICD